MISSIHFYCIKGATELVSSYSLALKELQTELISSYSFFIVLKELQS